MIPMRTYFWFYRAHLAMVLGFFLFLAPGKICFGANKAPEIAFMVLDHNSYIARLAIDSLDLPDKLKSGIAVISSADLAQTPEQMKQVISEVPIIVVDVMGRELESFVNNSIDPSKKPVYALRGSLDDESLKTAGFIFDDEVSNYYHHLSVDNVKSMLRLIIHRHLDEAVTYPPVKARPQLGIYHPDAKKLTADGSGMFTDIAGYLNWQEQRPGFDPDKHSIAFFFFSSFLTQGQQEPMDEIIRRLEAEGFNVFPCFGKEKDIIKNYILDSSGKSRVDMILAFSFKFYSGLTPELARLVEKMDVPIFNAISIYQDTLDQWRKSAVGIDAQSVAWSLAIPEISGLIEPTILAAKEKKVHQETGKAYYVSRLVDENMDRIIPRLKNWLVLQEKPAKDKRIALLFYNHHQGKQNIGASYLNVFRSIEQIASALNKNGYATGPVLTEENIKSMIIASARNVGSWAPGELDKMMDQGQIIRLPLDTYKQWFETLPQAFKEKVIDQWGRPERSFVMVKDKSFVIPAVRSGNLTILPEPARGWGDDPMKLYHDTTLYPHHQYLAVYLWLEKGFKADAMIHLGTHSTYEWTPGKQAGLSPSCSPEVLITNIPNIYPYIVDNIGEGIQAKRRGRGVMVSHLTPVLKKADIHQEYSRMAELVGEIEQAQAKGSLTLEEKVKELLSLAESTGIFSDLKDSVATDHDHYHVPEESVSHDHNKADLPALQIDRATADKIHLLGHYLEDINSDLIPFGMHTFGKSPEPDAVKELTAAVLEANPRFSKDKLNENIAGCGPNEINSLMKGLKGRYVHPGQGNDPIRNPEALPTGRNFYGFNPGKLPTPAAWTLGKKAARQIIDNHIIEHGAFPQKVAVIVWATETLRNEGVNESTILNLVGVKPKWSKTGRVLGLEVIKGKDLGRPRIDVMVNASGLYRDLFPDKMLYLDRAIRLAEKQNDVENLIARHTARIKTRLIQGGMAPEKAEQMSRFRVFSEPPGAYGNGVGDMASGSSKWDDPDQVVNVYENRMGFAFGQGKTKTDPTWGVAAKELFKAQLSQVDVAVHSRSSNVYGLLDNDDMFQYLGGLSMAIQKESGKAPETLITDQKKKGRVRVEDLGKTLGREMRARYLNPKWIEGMKAEDYAGANAMSNFVEYLWGWDLTTPEKVDEDKWQQTYDVYVQDKYGLKLKEFFDKASPWAYQSMTGRMLETYRKGYWQADQTQLETLAAEYAKSIVAKGIACCDHTCNNPLLNQMVVSIISIPGVVSPDIVNKFKIAVEQMAQKSLENQVEDRKQLIKKLQAPGTDSQTPDPTELKQKVEDRKPDKIKKSKPKEPTQDLEQIEGYKMEKIDKKDDTTKMTSSGVEWMAVLAVLAIIGLFAFGARKKKY